MAATQSELSMDEILASIRRIIHEEESPAPELDQSKGNTVALSEQRRALSDVPAQRQDGDAPDDAKTKPEDAPLPVRAVDPDKVKPMTLTDFGGPAAVTDPTPDAKPASSPADILAEAPVEPRPSAPTAPRAAAAKAAVTRSKARAAQPKPEAQPEAGPAPAAEEVAAPEQTGEAFEKVTLEARAAKADVSSKQESEEVSAPEDDAESERQALLSEAALDSAAAAFASLKESVRLTHRSPATLEDMVEQMLRPMLRAWLDENLPAIVEKKVEAEIRRLRDIA